MASYPQYVVHGIGASESEVTLTLEVTVDNFGIDPTTVANDLKSLLNNMLSITNATVTYKTISSQSM